MDKRSALTIQIYHSTFTESDIFSPFLYCVFGKGYRHLTEIELCFSTKTTLLKLYPSSLKIQLNPRLLLTSLLLDKISQDSSCRRSAAVSKGTVLNCRLFCFFFGEERLCEPTNNLEAQLQNQSAEPPSQQTSLPERVKGHSGRWEN